MRCPGVKNIDFIDGKLFKGDPVMIVGRPKTETWQDKDGGKRKAVKVTVEKIVYLKSGGAERDPQPPREQSRDRDDNRGRSQPTHRDTRRQSAPPPSRYDDGGAPDAYDDVPF